MHVAPRCNAPWVSAVIEANGDIRPCFFHPAIGNIHDGPLTCILNAPTAVGFRKNLDVETNPICRQCVCSLYIPHQQEQARGKPAASNFHRTQNADLGKDHTLRRKEE
jgi:sulfatase maturation enzyme AslB (radical SAM superfamily)